MINKVKSYSVQSIYLSFFFIFHLLTIIRLDYNPNDALAAGPPLKLQEQGSVPYKDVMAIYGFVFPYLQSIFLRIQLNFGSVYSLRLLQVILIILNFILAVVLVKKLSGLLLRSQNMSLLLLGVLGNLHYSNQFTELQSWVSDFVITIMLIQFHLFVLIIYAPTKVKFHILTFIHSILVFILLTSRLREGLTFIVGLIFISIYWKFINLRYFTLLLFTYLLLIYLSFFMWLQLNQTFDSFYRQFIYWPSVWSQVQDKEGLNSIFSLGLIVINLSPLILLILLFLYFNVSRFFVTLIFVLSFLPYGLTSLFRPNSNLPVNGLYLNIPLSVANTSFGYIVKLLRNPLVNFTYAIILLFFLIIILILPRAKKTYQQTYNDNQLSIFAFSLILAISGLTQIYPTYDVRHAWWSLFFIVIFLGLIAPSFKRINRLLIFTQSLFFLTLLVSIASKLTYIYFPRDYYDGISLLNGMKGYSKVVQEIKLETTFLESKIKNGSQIFNYCKDPLPSLFFNSYNSRDNYFVDFNLDSHYKRIVSYDYEKNFPGLRPAEDRFKEAGIYILCEEDLNTLNGKLSLAWETLEIESSNTKFVYLVIGEKNNAIE